MGTYSNIFEGVFRKECLPIAKMVRGIKEQIVRSNIFSKKVEWVLSDFAVL
jgi:hypothetical protein